MNKHEQYIENLFKTTFVDELTASMAKKELVANALLQILFEKKLITFDEWSDAFKDQVKKFILDNTEGYNELYEPEIIDINPKPLKSHK